MAETALSTLAGRCGGPVVSGVAAEKGQGVVQTDCHAQGHQLQARQLAAERLGQAIFVLLLVLAAAAPFSPHFVQFISHLAFVLWIVRVALVREWNRQPVSLPFLTFFAIAGLSALFLYDTLLSWNSVGWFGMATLVLIVPDVVQSGRDLKLLLFLLLASSSLSGIRTASQYTAGIGTELAYVRRDCPLAGDGLW